MSTRTTSEMAQSRCSANKIHTTLFLCLLFLIGAVRFELPFASVEAPIAVITELKPGKGTVEIRQPGKALWERPAPLQLLYTGTHVRASKDATAVILFLEEIRVIAVQERNSPYELRLSKRRVATEVAGLLKNFFSSMKKKAPPDFRPIVVRGPSVTLISPRNTKVRSISPTFVWFGTEEATATFLLYDPSGLVWKAAELNANQLSYPASAPQLRPGVDYLWLLETKKFPHQKALFNVVDADTAKIVQERLKSVQDASLPKTTHAILEAGLLIGHELFHEAREILIGALATDPNEPGLHLLLGAIYQKTGLEELAGEEYRKADFPMK